MLFVIIFVCLFDVVDIMVVWFLYLGSLRLVIVCGKRIVGLGEDILFMFMFTFIFVCLFICVFVFVCVCWRYLLLMVVLFFCLCVFFLGGGWWI